MSIAKRKKKWRPKKKFLGLKKRRKFIVKAKEMSVIPSSKEIEDLIANGWSLEVSSGSTKFKFSGLSVIIKQNEVTLDFGGEQIVLTDADMLLLAKIFQSLKA